MNKKHSFLLVLGIVIIFCGYYFTVRHFFPTTMEMGQFGDMFGAINALFSGLAFLGVTYAIVLQREELSLQRNELELTRKELKRSAHAQEKAEEALSKQAASLKISAKLNGLSAILQHHNTLIGTTNLAHGLDIVSFNTHKRDANEVISEIESLIEGK